MNRIPNFLKTTKDITTLHDHEMICDIEYQDVTKRISDWLSNTTNTIQDHYILSQLWYAETIAISNTSEQQVKDII